VLPANLVPCCRDCNTAKGQRTPHSESEQTIHPYFDDFETDLWLAASILQTDPLSIQYFVQGPAGWGQEKMQRAAYHMQKLKVFERYSDVAAQELVEIKSMLVDLRQVGGSLLVQQHLQDTLDSRARPAKNSWSAALYAALAASPWFCDVGLHQIP
jgi:hypothetical protein